MDPAGIGDGGVLHDIAEADQREGRGQGEADPCRQAAAQAGAGEPDGDADLAARGAGQELAETDEIGECLLIEPPAPLHLLGAETAQMGDRSTERGQAQPQSNAEDLPGRPATWRVRHLDA